MFGQILWRLCSTVKAVTNTLDLLAALPSNADLLAKELAATKERLSVLRKLARIAKAEAAKKAKRRDTGHPAVK
jgi:hypothetical protein